MELVLTHILIVSPQKYFFNQGFSLILPLLNTFSPLSPVCGVFFDNFQRLRWSDRSIAACMRWQLLLLPDAAV